MINVLVWNEFRHENLREDVKKVYPNGIHNAIKDFLESDEISVKTATLDEENCGITKEILDETDVLIWWGHAAHNEVPDHVADLVRDAVQQGMGAIFLHSAHLSKPFTRLMGTTCNLLWLENGASERLFMVDPSHPIVQGIDRCIELPHEEIYAEPFDIPSPHDYIIGSCFEGGEIFRSGCCFKRGYGKIFYFQPGHESYPTYYDKNIQRIIKNAVVWAKPIYRAPVALYRLKK